jgi:succinoglycan biosynthesis transport protein ExoP
VNLQMYDLWKIIKQRLMLIVIATVVAVAATGLISFYVLIPQYEATTTLLVQPVNLFEEITYNDLIANEKLVTTYTEIIKSRMIAQDVILRMNLNIPEQELLKNVKVIGIKNTLITAITVISPDPLQAVSIANCFAQSFRDNLSEIMKVENVSILDEAKLEDNPKPVSPKPLLNMLIMLFLIFNTGIFLAIFSEMMDKTVKLQGYTNEIFGLPLLGIISKYPQRRESIFCLDMPKSPQAEAFRTLRTNVNYMQLSKKIRTLQITSSMPKEGKSMIIANLAVAMAQEKKKILLMDCDLRKPSIHNIFGITNSYGITSILTGELDVHQVIIKTKQLNLDVITSGPIPPNPSELLAMERAKQLIEQLKEEYDTILFDSPPVLPVTDGQILAKYADAVVMIIKLGSTQSESVKQAKYMLEHVNARLIGVVLNYGKSQSKDYYYK